MKRTLLLLVIACIAFTSQAQKREYAPIPKDIPTVEKVKSKIGKLEMPNGYPTDATAALLEDEILYVQRLGIVVASTVLYLTGEIGEVYTRIG